PGSQSQRLGCGFNDAYRFSARVRLIYMPFRPDT
ncbi:MAG: hypothetical protein ACI9NC_004528, partial [Verrucomicrobiales bacterium]